MFPHKHCGFQLSKLLRMESSKHCCKYNANFEFLSFGIRSILQAGLALYIAFGCQAAAGAEEWFFCWRDRKTLKRITQFGGTTLLDLGKGPFRPKDILPHKVTLDHSLVETGVCTLPPSFNLHSEDSWHRDTYSVTSTVDPSNLSYLPKQDPYTAVRRSIFRIIPIHPVEDTNDGAPDAQAGTGFLVKRQGNRAWIATARHVVISADNKPFRRVEAEIYSGNLPSELRLARVSLNLDPLLIVTSSNSELIEQMETVVGEISMHGSDSEAMQPKGRGAHGTAKRHISDASIEEEQAFVRRMMLDQMHLRASNLIQGLFLKALTNNSNHPDIVVLEVEQPLPLDIQPLPLSMSTPRGLLTVVGHPHNKPPWAVENFSILKTTDKDIVLDGGLEPGASGSPVLNDSGEVVGIVYETTTYARGDLSLVSCYRSRLLQEMIP